MEPECTYVPTVLCKDPSNPVFVFAICDSGGCTITQSRANPIIREVAMAGKKDQLPRLKTVIDGAPEFWDVLLVPLTVNLDAGEEVSR